MNQNHWNDNDQNQNDCTEPTSSNFQNSKNKMRAKKLFSPMKAIRSTKAAIVIVMLLGLSLCLAAHAMGSLTTDSPSPDGAALPGDDLPGFETSSEKAISDAPADNGSEREHGTVDAGLTLYDVSNRITAWSNFKLTRLGVYIVESKYCDELQYGDYLLSINGISVSSVADAQRICNACAVGDTVVLEVIRAQAKEQDSCQQVKETTVTVKVILREYWPRGVYFDTK